jgi:hypothetical protein
MRRLEGRRNGIIEQPKRGYNYGETYDDSACLLVDSYEICIRHAALRAEDGKDNKEIDSQINIMSFNCG